MRKITLLACTGMGSLIVLITLSFLIWLFFSPNTPTILHRPLPEQVLKTPEGESVHITHKFPHQDYLIIFFAESSPSSLEELTSVNSTIFPDNLVVILVHIGRISRKLPITTNNQLILLIDSNGDLAQKMGIRTVPTTILLIKHEYQIGFFEKPLTTADLALIPEKLVKSKNYLPLP